MKFAIGLLLILPLSACAGTSVSPASTSNNEGSLINNYNQQVRLCGTAWRKLYNEWIHNGGGIKDSITETREQIASDKKSKFARIIRDVWNSSNDAQAEKNQLWRWPINKIKSRKISFLFGYISKGYVPKECSDLAWLSSIVWDDIRFVNGDPLKFQMPSEASANVNWNGYTAPNWILYWLLIKLPDQ